MSDNVQVAHAEKALSQKDKATIEAAIGKINSAPAAVLAKLYKDSFDEAMNHEQIRQSDRVLVCQKVISDILQAGG